MATILKSDGTAWPWTNYAKTAIDDWTAVTVAFEAVKSPSSFSFTVPTPVWGDILTGDGVERLAAVLTNDAGEPYMRLSGWLCVTSQDEATTSVTFYSDARASEAGMTLQEVAKARIPSYINAEPYLVRSGTDYTLDGYAIDWELVELASSNGAYKLAFFKLTDDVLVLANGVKVETGTDAEGKPLKEANYIDAGCSWRLPLITALPAKKVSDALNAYYWPLGKRLIYDPSGVLTLIDGDKTGMPRYTPMVAATAALSAIDPLRHNGTVELTHALTEVKLGAELYPATRGTVKYGEGWTDTLLQWVKQGYAGADEATVCTIGVNGQATTGNYLDDEGKPYSGLVFKSRPEPAGNSDFLAQFAMTKHARKVTFKSAQLLPVNATIPLGTGVAWVTKRTRTAAGYDYEGVAAMQTDVELLTTSTLIFAPTGGSKWVAAGGAGMTWTADETLTGGAWPVAVKSRNVGGAAVSQAVVTVGANSYVMGLYDLAKASPSDAELAACFAASLWNIEPSEAWLAKVGTTLAGKLTGSGGLDVTAKVAGWQTETTVERVNVDYAKVGIPQGVEKTCGAGSWLVVCGSVKRTDVECAVLVNGLFATAHSCNMRPMVIAVKDVGEKSLRYDFLYDDDDKGDFSAFGYNILNIYLTKNEVVKINVVYNMTQEGSTEVIEHKISTLRLSPKQI